VSTTGSRPLTAELVIGVAGRIVDEQGTEALTMRRLADELGVAVTGIYWHVGNRENLVDALVDRLLTDMGTLRPRGASPRERIASLARALRRKLLERPHLVALAHEQAKTALMFQPVQAAIADELAVLGLRGAEAALALRALQVHVVTSVLLERTVDRYPTGQPETIAELPWLLAHDDAELVVALSRPVDPLEVFELTLHALLDALPSPM